MSSLNLFTAGCSNVQDHKIHLCSDAASNEKSNSANPLLLAKTINSESVNPSNSTKTGTNEGLDSSHSTETGPLNYFEKMLEEEDEGLGHPGFPSENVYCVKSPSSEHDIAKKPVTVTQGVFSPTTESSSGEEPDIEGNLNKMETEKASIEEELITFKTLPQSQPKGKPSQSKYKNKPKEVLEKSVAVLKHCIEMDTNEANTIRKENRKCYEEWRKDEEEIRALLRKVDMEVKDGVKRESVKRKIMLDHLKAKQYCCFAELYSYKDRIQPYTSDVITNFGKGYKNNVSQTFFKSRVRDKDLFSWILLLQIALAILPQDQETVQLLPLKRESVFFNCWMLEGKLKPANQELYKNAYVRNHLRRVFTEALATLMQRARTQMEAGGLGLLQEISCALTGDFERSQRPMYTVVGLRTAVNYQAMGEMNGKRSSDLCFGGFERITKKVNGDRSDFE